MSIEQWPKKIKRTLGLGALTLAGLVAMEKSTEAQAPLYTSMYKGPQANVAQELPFRIEAVHDATPRDQVWGWTMQTTWPKAEAAAKYIQDHPEVAQPFKKGKEYRNAILIENEGMIVFYWDGKTWVTEKISDRTGTNYTTGMTRIYTIR
jgi:hypothetical protein